MAGRPRRRFPSWREWPVWQLSPALRWYVIVVPLVAADATAAVAPLTPFTARQWLTFAILLSCGLASVEATRRIDYSQGGLVRDLLTVWCLPVAILLPPFFALLAPVPLLTLTQLRVHRGLIHRRVFSAAAIGLGYAVASAAFRALPPSIAGPSLGSGRHAVTWAAAVAAVDVLAWLIHNTLIVAAIKGSDPAVRTADLVANREALFADFVQWSLATVVTIVAAVSPLLLIAAAPFVLMQRRFMMHAQLVSSSRKDAKTGLLNAAVWEREAAAEIVRCVRGGAQLAVMLADIDHFKLVNDTYGHLAGDEVLRAVSGAIIGALRDQDVIGRFGGEEFAVLLPQTTADGAYGTAERLRQRIEALPVRGAEGGPSGISVTVSIGVALLTSGQPSLTDFLAAADTALYSAKDNGRNQTCLVSDTSGPRHSRNQPG